MSQLKFGSLVDLTPQQRAAAPAAAALGGARGSSGASTKKPQGRAPRVVTVGDLMASGSRGGGEKKAATKLVSSASAGWAKLGQWTRQAAKDVKQGVEKVSAPRGASQSIIASFQMR